MNDLPASLYAVDYACHKEILNWFDLVRKTGREPGLDIIPADFRLDTVKLKLEGV